MTGQSPKGFSSQAAEAETPTAGLRRSSRRGKKLFNAAAVEIAMDDSQEEGGEGSPSTDECENRRGRSRVIRRPLNVEAELVRRVAMYREELLRGYQVPEPPPPLPPRYAWCKFQTTGMSQGASGALVQNSKQSGHDKLDSKPVYILEFPPGLSTGVHSGAFLATLVWPAA